MTQRWPLYVQKQEIFNRLDYTPYPLQEPVHHSEARVIQIVGAEGGGKSFVAAKEVVSRIPWCKLVYLVGEEYENAIREFDYLAEDLMALGLADRSTISRPRNPPWQIVTTTGCVIRNVSVTKSGASGVIAKGEEPDIIVLCEAGKVQSEQVFTASIRRATRVDGLVLLSGTLADDLSWYAQLEDDLKEPDNPYRGDTFSIPAWANLSRYPGGEGDPEIVRLKEILPEDEYARTVAARKMTSLAAIMGDVFDPNIHIKSCPYTNNVPVELWIDPGYFPSAYAVVVVQYHGDVAWQIDEVYEHRTVHEQIIELCKEREWWPAVRTLVGDQAIYQHPGDRSGAEVWLAKTGMTVQTMKLRVQDGISRHRSILHQKRLFHDEKCRNTIREYKMYRRRVNKDGVPVSDDPEDRQNHSMKAIAYGLSKHWGLSDMPRPTRTYKPDPWRNMMRKR